jgi:hypothetical protein
MLALALFLQQYAIYVKDRKASRLASCSKRSPSRATPSFLPNLDDHERYTYSRESKTMKKLLAAAFAALLSIASPLQAQASNFSSSGWQTGFTVNTTSEGFDGSGDYVITVTWNHTAALFSTSAASSGTLFVNGKRVLQCDTASVTYTYNVVNTPSGCSSLGSTSVATVSGNNSVLTVVFTISAANYAGKTRTFIVPDVWFTDANGDDLIVPVGGLSGGSSNQSTPAPVKYAGPEFSGLSAKPVAVGSSSVLEGKRLNEVSSITIGGKSATFTATSATELILSLPAGLAPGLYDLVINSSAGKLTQINAVRVQGPLTALSVTTVAEGRISSEQLHEHALIAAMQQPELTKARCIVNGPNLAQAKAQAERLCALVRASNKNIETTVVESRSTVKNNKVYARVSYGWN